MGDWKRRNRGNQPRLRARSFERELGERHQDAAKPRGMIRSQGFTYDFGDDPDTPKFRPATFEDPHLRSSDHGDDTHFDHHDNSDKRGIQRDRSPVAGRSGIVDRERQRQSLSPVAVRSHRNDKMSMDQPQRDDRLTQAPNERQNPAPESISNVVLMTGIPKGTRKIDVYPLLFPRYEAVFSLKLFANRSPGTATVTFYTNEQAKTWMEKSKGKAVLSKEKIGLEYKIPGVSVPKGKNIMWDRWVTDKPSNNMVMWNLPSDAKIGQIRQKFRGIGTSLVTCKVMQNRQKNNGKNLGFGFLDFGVVANAERWHYDYKGIFDLHGQIVMTAFSCGSSEPTKPWICTKCLTDNFKGRQFCIRCLGPKLECELSVDGSNNVGSNPCNTLIFHGLDALTTEENLQQALQSSTGITCRKIQVVRDPQMGVSLSYAFGEMSSLEEARQVMQSHGTDVSSASPLELGGKQIMLSYANDTFSNLISPSLAVTEQPAPQDVQLLLPEMEEVSSDEEMMELESEIAAPVEPPVEPPPKLQAPVEKKAKPIPPFESPPKREVKKVIKKKDTKLAEMTKKTSKPRKNVNYQKLIFMTNYIYDPTTDTYFSHGCNVPCPVPECELKPLKDWRGLKTHWQTLHVPTKRVYFCRLRSCRNKPKKVQYTENNFRHHLLAHKEVLPDDLEEEISNSKSKLKPNLNYIDPGSEVLPPPEEVCGPIIDVPNTECPVTNCTATYTTLESMKQHWNHYHSPMVTMYRCGLCDTIDRDKDVMTAHMIDVHNDKKTSLDKVRLTSKRFIDPGDVVPFWALFNDKYKDEDEDDIEGNDDRLGPDFPLGKIPDPGNDPEDLLEFLSWTERYLHRLDLAHKDARLDLQKMARRKLEEK